MKAWLLETMRCPACIEAGRPGDLGIFGGAGSPEGNLEPGRILAEGVLECATCEARYPVLDEAPRMLPISDLTAAEKAVLDDLAPRITEPDESRGMDSQERENRIREIILRDYGYPTSGGSLKRAMDDFAYQQAYPRGRVYQMKLLRKLIGRAPEILLDIGGGSGGNLEAARQAFPLRHGIVADLRTDWPPLYQTGDRSIAYVRADARRLPFRSAAFELVISSFLIEHVREWQRVVREATRLGTYAFIGFGPNRTFPVELGHFDVPLVHCLPPSAGSLAALGWGAVTGNRRSLRNIRRTLSEMNYITSSEYYLFCRSQGIRCTNIFVDMFEAWAEEGRKGLRGLLGRNRTMTRGLSRLMVYMGAEPNIYSLIRSGTAEEPLAASSAR
ncbi:MAG TPA: class I SAM-dependent methyltransferase [Candidatus Polarisedimenticolia bacterium]|nr:class I SAM-dependent methyltransferase [Candidatus Polarisedimenticolia bacterium]